MNRSLRVCAATLTGVLVIGGCQRDSNDRSMVSNEVVPHIVEHQFKADELLVKYKPGVAPGEADSSYRQKGGLSARRFQTQAKSKSASTPMERWRHVTLPSGTDIKSALDQYRRDPNVEYVEPNYRFSVRSVPDDPDFRTQWSLRNIGQSLSYTTQAGGVPGADIAAVPAWDIQTGSSSVIVAVLDTGVDTSHPDIAANIWTNPGEIPDNGIDDDGNGYVDDINGYDFVGNSNVVEDGNGHGTHVAGIAAAVGNNATGITGVAWDARVMALKIFDASGAGNVSDAIDAILYATQMGVKITNNSWGGYSYSQALRDAISAANDAGVLVVAGAGNDSNNNDVTPFYPASYDLPNVVSVAATNRVDARANFSNYGRTTVNLGAPGDFIYSLSPGAEYNYRSGTSMATPHVAGTAALLLSQFPGLSAIGLKALLLDRSSQLPAMRDITTTGGRLNAKYALECDPAQVLLGVRAPADGFAVLGGDPTTIRAQMTSCGRSVTDYQLLASFSNGDAQITLFDDGLHGDGAAGDGIYGNYWVPQNIGAVSASVTATSAGQPALSRTLNGNVRQRVRYQHQTVPYSWIDATAGTTYALGNDGSVTIPIGFNFDFYGLTRDAITINANGLLTFGSSLPSADNSHLPNPVVPNDLISPFWDDLDPASGGVYSLLEGVVPNRRLTVSWVNVARNGVVGAVSFEATLYEGSNDIVFNHQDVVFGDDQYDFGANAVVGVEDPDGLDATVFLDHQRLLNDSTARRFYVVPAEPELTYRVTVTTTPVRSLSGKLVMSLVDGDGINNNYFNILQFSADGDIILNPVLTGDAAGSFIPSPAYLGDAGFSNLISQPAIFGNQISFLLRVSRNGIFQPYPDSYAFYLLDSTDQPYPTSDPLGTDALFAIEIDRPQPFPLIFVSAYASVSVETVGAPIANPGGPYVGVINAPIAFDGTASLDGESDPLTFAWDFGDGATGTGATPSHAYAIAGLYTVTLTVSDGALYSAPATAQVTIGNSQPPIADAGPDQTVDQNVQVTLSGAASTDVDGTIVSYSWRQTAGPAVTLAGGNTVNANFTSPLVNAATTLTFELTVTDSSGDTGKNTVNVTVLKNNIPPSANAGPDQTVNEGVQVTLNATGSSDLDGTISQYAWQQISGPIAPLSLTATPGIVRFTAPAVPADSVLTFRITVTDNQGASATDTVNVTTLNTDDPVARPGPDRTVDEQASVTLDGSASSDPDGTIVSYSWEQLSGLLVPLTGANTAVAHFNAPSVSADQQLLFRLNVTDNNGNVGSAFLNITIRNIVIPPVAKGGPDKTVTSGDSVVLHGGNSSDSDGTITSFTWTQISGVPVSLSGSSTVQATFTAPQVTSDTPLVFRLTVVDNDGASATDDVTVIVRKVIVPPVASAGPDQTVNERTMASLNGTGSNDPDGATLTYQWSQVMGPTVSLTAANSAQPSFTAPSVPANTVLRFALAVTDGDGATSTDSVDVTVLNVDAVPTANAGPDQTANERTVVALNGQGSVDPVGGGLSYQWTQTLGPSVTLANATTSQPSFTAPQVPSATTLRFMLQVTTAGGGASSTDTVDVTVLNVDAPPIANAGPDQTVVEGATVQLNGTGSSAPAGTIVQYQWVQTAGTTVTLSSSASATPSFVAPTTAGTLSFSLTVTDSNAGVATDSVSIAVTDVDVDGDRDQLSDGWEIQFFGGLAQAGAGDPDGDGINNRLEFVNGSNPLVAAPAPISAPTVAVIPGDTDNTVVFSRVADAGHYDIYWGTSPSLTKATGTKVASVANPYPHTGRTNGTAYYYLVVAGNAAGDGPSSVVVSGVPGVRSWKVPAVAVAAATQWEGSDDSVNLAVDGAGNAISAYTTITGSFWNVWTQRYDHIAGWQTPELMARSTAKTTYAKISMNSRGDAVVIWQQDDGSTTRFDLWSRTRFAGQSAWSAAELLENYNGDGTHNGGVDSAWVDVGEDGTVVAAWAQRERSGVTSHAMFASARSEGTAWSPRARIDVTDTSGSYSPRIRVDGQGNALVAWIRTNCDFSCPATPLNRILSARYSIASGWSAPVELASNDGRLLGAISLGADATGNGVIVFVKLGGTANKPNTDVIARAYRVGTGWGSATVIDSAATALGSYGPQLAMRQDGRGVVAWRQGTTLYANFLSAAGTWSGLKTLTKVTGDPSSVGLDSQGQGHAVWTETNTNVSATVVNVARRPWGAKLAPFTGSSVHPSTFKLRLGPSGNGFAIGSDPSAIRFNRYAVQ